MRILIHPGSIYGVHTMDNNSGMIHSVAVTASSVHDLTQASEMLAAHYLSPDLRSRLHCRTGSVGFTGSA